MAIVAVAVVSVVAARYDPDRYDPVRCGRCDRYGFSISETTRSDRCRPHRPASVPVVWRCRRRAGQIARRRCRRFRGGPRRPRSCRSDQPRRSPVHGPGRSGRSVRAQVHPLFRFGPEHHQRKLAVMAIRAGALALKHERDLLGRVQVRQAAHFRCRWHRRAHRFRNIHIQTHISSFPHEPLTIVKYDCLERLKSFLPTMTNPGRIRRKGGLSTGTHSQNHDERTLVGVTR